MDKIKDILAKHGWSHWDSHLWKKGDLVVDVYDAIEIEFAALRTRLADAESALAEAREAFEILADAPVTDGWVIVAPQFVRANLDALNAALLAQPAAASIPPCCCAEIESAGVVNPDCLRHGAMHTAAASE